MHTVPFGQPVLLSQLIEQKPPGKSPPVRHRSSHSDDTSQRAPIDRDTGSELHAVSASAKRITRIAANVRPAPPPANFWE